MIVIGSWLVLVDRSKQGRHYTLQAQTNFPYPADVVLQRLYYPYLAASLTVTKREQCYVLNEICLDMVLFSKLQLTWHRCYKD